MDFWDSGGVSATITNYMSVTDTNSGISYAKSVFRVAKTVFLANGGLSEGHPPLSSFLSVSGV